MSSIVALLVAAVQLLTMANSADVPQALKDQAVSVANNAITYAEAYLNAPPVTVSVPVTNVVSTDSTSTQNVPQVSAPVIPQVVSTPAPSLARMDIRVLAGDPLIASSSPSAKAHSYQGIRFEVRTFDATGNETKLPVTATTNTPDLPSSFIFNSTDPNNQVQFVEVCQGWNPKNGSNCVEDSPSTPGSFSITFHEPINDITKTVNFNVY